ncbi:hypothetical protein [Alicyclobacillus vulcanalis]|uniref:Uncharacterized protein n=1 Tax=Alicyclobacillus vulcanalis TaxID=252246 RepID=A0A1N7N491_9BACL|nr:hypothetical protein [Alicyclobacillus vulcanalis]SIS93150.1 hypothetical protein SAMN05421799_10758 [Alicyclobacillus vulcanalis]
MPAIESSRSGRLPYRPLERVFLLGSLILAAGLVSWGAWTERSQRVVQPVLSGPAGALAVESPPVVTSFRTPSQPVHSLQGSTSLLLPPYYGWEANGSAGHALGYVQVRNGLLTVGVREGTPEFRGYFLTTRNPFPSGWYAHTWAVSPPAVDQGIGELVFAVQTASTDQTGLINYVFVSLVTTRFHGKMRSTWEVGYAYGYERNAHSVILKKLPESAVSPVDGKYHIVVWTNGSTGYRAWINGQEVYASNTLHMQIAPPLDAYLEVQEKGTAYAVQYQTFAAVPGDGVTVRGLPEGATVHWGGHSYTPKNGVCVLPLPAAVGERQGQLTIQANDRETSGTIQLWAGEVLQYEPS